MKEQVVPGATLPQWDFSIDQERDLFQKFPTLAQPNNMMLLWGGAESRSLLHVDPYNWTGTNGVIYGKKYWKFYPPSFPAVDGALPVRPAASSSPGCSPLCGSLSFYLDSSAMMAAPPAVLPARCARGAALPVGTN